MAASLQQRFATAVEADDAFLGRLRSVCAEVVQDEESAVAAGRDWWPLTMVWARHGEMPARPAALARPTSAAEVAAVLSLCSSERMPVTPFAGRSGVCGASLPVFGGVSLDLCRLDGITAVDHDSLLVDVLPGTFGHVFEAALRADHGLTLGHWPQSIELSTVGGWLACRSAGQYSTRYGKIEDMVVGLDVALADGRILGLGGRAPRSATGPDLTQLFVGSEGTLGVITAARLRARPLPPADRRAAYGFAGPASFADGLEACRRILRRGATPAVLRLYDHREAKRSFDVADDQAVLIVLDEAEPGLVDAVMAIVDAECSAARAAPLDPGLVDRWLSHRNDVSGLQKAVDQGITVDTIEIAARWSALPAIYADAIAEAKAVPGCWVVSAHQSNAAVVALVLVLFVAPFIGGAIAAMDERATPYVHGAIAGAIGWLAIVLHALGRQLFGNGSPNAATLIATGIVNVSVGMLGGYFSFRRLLRKEASDQSPRR